MKNTTFAKIFRGAIFRIPEDNPLSAGVLSGIAYHYEFPRILLRVYAILVVLVFAGASYFGSGYPQILAMLSLLALIVSYFAAAIFMPKARSIPPEYHERVGMNPLY